MSIRQVVAGQLSGAVKTGIKNIGNSLRGRIGRGTKESFCILLHKDKLGDISSKRLDVLVETQDGFKIAEKDLEISALLAFSPRFKPIVIPAAIA